MPSPNTAAKPMLIVRAVNATGSDPSCRLTRAGVVLSADARAKLQALADWLEGELEHTNVPGTGVSFGQCGAIVTRQTWQAKHTFVSPIGALVQMYQPFKLDEAEQIAIGYWRIPMTRVIERAAGILGVSIEDLEKVRRFYLMYNASLPTIISQLRMLS